MHALMHDLSYVCHVSTAAGAQDVLISVHRSVFHSTVLLAAIVEAGASDDDGLPGNPGETLGEAMADPYRDKGNQGATPSLTPGYHLHQGSISWLQHVLAVGA